jgi:alkylation response protein AidB-like acyl-CoA dehydrogenase
VGYLKAAVPTELGGLGLRLADLCLAQRRLGYFGIFKKTVLGINPDSTPRWG